MSEYIDCPKCKGWAETRTGHECDCCGATGEVTEIEALRIEYARRLGLEHLRGCPTCTSSVNDSIATDLIAARRGNQ